MPSRLNELELGAFQLRPGRLPQGEGTHVCLRPGRLPQEVTLGRLPQGGRETPPAVRRGGPTAPGNGLSQMEMDRMYSDVGVCHRWREHMPAKRGPDVIPDSESAAWW